MTKLHLIRKSITKLTRSLAVTSIAYASILVPAAVLAAAALPTTTGSATKTISVQSAGTYYIWSRMLATDASSDSFWIQIDGGAGINVGDGGVPFGSWTWVSHQNGNTSSRVSVSLTQGSHTLTILGREAGTKLDAVVLSPDPNFNPANPEIVDSTPPVVTVNSPANNATVGGTAQVNVTATDNSSVSSVDLLIDNNVVNTQTVGSNSIYTLPWDTTKATNGSHSLMVKATDIAGNVGASSVLNVNVSQPTPPPPPPSPTPPPPPPTIVGDLNSDGKVNVLDFSILLRNWNTLGGVADLNHDGIVNVIDFSIMLRNWTG